MIDPVELKALVEKATPGPWEKEPEGGRGSWIKGSNGHWAALSCGESNSEAIYNGRLIALAPTLARQVLALSDEVERIDKDRESWKAAHYLLNVQLTAAESEAQALRERMGEINSTVRLTAKSDKTHCILALDRIAALSTTPKEKEG